MNYILVRHRVENFERWKKVFYDRLPAAEASGMKLKQILRSIDDPQIAFCYLEVTDMEKARSFTNSEDVPNAQKETRLLEVEGWWLSDVT